MSYKLGFVYKSADEPPIATGDPIYVPGHMTDGGIKGEFPSELYETTVRDTALSAIPNGYKIGKTNAPWKIPFPLVTEPCDAVPFYLGMGLAAVDAGDDDYTIDLRADGETPEVYLHDEIKRFKTDTVREYWARVVKSKMTFNNVDMLEVTQEFVIGRVYDMTTDKSVANTTNPVTLMGDKSPHIRYPRRHPNRTLTWNSLTLGAHFHNVEFEWESMFTPAPLEDGLAYLPSLQGHGRWKFGAVIITLYLEATSDDLNSLREDLGVASDLVLVCPRQHANDKLTFTWADVVLTKISPDAGILETATDKKPFIRLIFEHPTAFTVAERQCDAAGDSNINTALQTYELT